MTASATRAQVDAWKQRVLDLRCGWEWHLANGARNVGVYNPPALQRVLEEEARLIALIGEHAPGGER